MPDQGKGFMKQNQRLSERLVNSGESYLPSNKKWNEFVRDHKAYLRRKSTTTQYAPELLVRYRYRPEEFYQEQCDGSLYLAWIWMLVNDIYNVTQFTESRTEYYNVSADDLRELYLAFRSCINSKED